MQGINYWHDRATNYENIRWVSKGSMIEDMVSFAGNVNCMRLLDLGTGTGKVLDTFKIHFPNGEYFGIDISPDMVKNIFPGKGYTIKQCCMEEMPDFDDSYFDVVTARMVMHHSEDIIKTFNEVKRVLKSGGIFIICEGTPPSVDSLDFYKEMFKYKEERHTFLIDDLTNYFLGSNYSNIYAKVTVLEDMSLNNWLYNSGVPDENINIIKNMHLNAPQNVKEAYSMRIVKDDILMRWKFVVVCGRKV